MSDRSVTVGKPSLAVRIETEKGFVIFAAFGAVVLAYDAPLRWAGRGAQRIRNWVLRKRPPLEGLDETLLAQRNEIRTVLGRQWWLAGPIAYGLFRIRYRGRGSPSEQAAAPA